MLYYNNFGFSGIHLQGPLLWVIVLLGYIVLGLCIFVVFHLSVHRGSRSEVEKARECITIVSSKDVEQLLSQLTLEVRNDSIRECLLNFISDVKQIKKLRNNETFTYVFTEEEWDHILRTVTKLTNQYCAWERQFDLTMSEQSMKVVTEKFLINIQKEVRDRLSVYVDKEQNSLGVLLAVESSERSF